MAVQQARDKANWRRVTAHFLVGDALNSSTLTATGLSFRTVVDSAMFHVLGDRERDRFVDELKWLPVSSGLYCVLGDARRSEREIYGVTPAEVRNRFRATDGWEVVFASQTVFERRWSTNPAYIVCVQRQ